MTATIRLVFDSTVLAQAQRSERARAGIHRYVSQLLPALETWCDLKCLSHCRDPFLRRWHPGTPSPTGPHTLKTLLLQQGLVKTAKPLWRAVQATPWARSGQRRYLAELLEEAGIDPAMAVYHSPYAAIPPEVRRAGFAAVVLTVHDMLPLLKPRLFPRETVIGFRRALASLQSADHLICVSESTRADVMRLQSRVPQAHVHVVPLAASADLKPIRDRSSLEHLRQRFDLAPDDRLILSLGTLEPRKNLRLVLEAFRRLQERHPTLPCKLLLVGASGWKVDSLLRHLADHSSTAAIRLTGFLEDGLLATLYSCADVFVYPSLYEGFGLPPLEAMQCGTPVIVSDRSCLPDLVGNAGLQIDPENAEDLCKAMETVLLEPATRQHLAEQGLKRAAAFHWRRTAEETRQVYLHALGLT